MDYASWGALAIALITGMGGVLIAYGKLREQIVTKNNCKISQSNCQSKICKKLDDNKDLIQKLHDEIADNINAISDRMRYMDKNREAAKDGFNEELRKIALSIGRLEGRIGSD